MKPEKVVLGAHEWKIEWDLVPEEIKEAYDIEETSGLFYDPGGKIYVVPEYSTQRQRVTLLHEIVHAIALKHGLNLKELEVESLASALYDLINQNPELIAWIQGKEE